MAFFEKASQFCDAAHGLSRAWSFGGPGQRKNHKRNQHEAIPFPLRVLALVASLFLIAGTLDSVDAGPAALMTVPGQPSVSSSGAFTYSIPIRVPPGTAGIVPSLSLQYSSQAGDGILGLGWSLGGISVIAHCPQTLAQDNLHGGVNYDANDRFCLDGQRLILVSGTYGTDGSIYRTEIDHFSKIVAHGAAGNGPAWFEVHTPKGLDLQYGNTSNSLILAVGKATARAWALNQVTDPKGNYFTLTYTNDTTNGQFYPNRIDYTGNAAAGLATYNSIQFSYTTRPDIVPTYQAGSLIQTTVLLTDVKTYNGSSLVLDYKLGYALASSAASHDELNSVTLCDTNGVCLAPTTFGWQGSRDNPAMTSTANSIAQGAGLLAGDFNGDGLTDVAVVPTSCSSNAIYLGNTSGGFTQSNITTEYDTFEPLPGGTLQTVNYNSLACFWPAAVVGDINGDGLTDVAMDVTYWHYFPAGGTWRSHETTAVLKNTGTGQLNQVNADNSLGWPFIFAPPAFPSDYNGDGRSDGWLGVTAGVGYAANSNGDGTFTPDSGHSGFPTTATLFLPGDFDGDGCTDMLAQGGGTGAIVYFCQPAATSVTVPDWSGNQLVLADFNGDGKTDVLVISSTGATLYLSTGTGFATGISIPNSSTWHNYTVVYGDWNGDGKADIALISKINGQSHVILLSTGTGFFQLATIANSDTNTTATVADWNSDGAQDLWIQKASGDTEYLFSYTPELMTTVSNGVGATTTVTYDRLNHATVYTKGSGASYPTQDVDGPLYVVSKLSTSNGIGGTDSWTYAYAGLKRDLWGRGFLGFSQQTVTDSQTGIVTTTNYHTDFPYVGLPSSQTVVSGSTTLKSVTNTYTSTNEGGSSPGAAYYFVALQQSAVNGADLDGSALPSSTTSFTYDSYGNVLTKSVSVSDGSSSVTTNTYNNDTTDWFIGQLLTSQTQNIVGSSNLTRHMSMAWSPTSKPDQLVLEPGNSALSVTESIGYDLYDNANSQSFSGTGVATRTSSLTFDSKGEFATTITNGLSQSDTVAYNTNFGEATSVTDPNGITSTAGFDTFGRQTSAVKPDGNQTVMSYAYCSGVNGGTASCPTYGAYLVQAEPETSNGGQNGPITITYYDALGRAIGSDTQGFDGSWIRVSAQYDANGRVQQTSRPYFVSGGTPKWTDYTYDLLNRVTQATFPDSSSSTYAYHGLTTLVTNAQGQTTTTVKNAQGLVASRTDANNKTTTYVYDAFGNPVTVTDPAGNVISNVYDLRGRKTAMTDPDMGSWSYSYDVLSELTSQTDAKSQTTSISYDLLGRPTQRVEPDLVSNWVYDTAAHGIGALTSACTQSGCTNYSNSQSWRALAYDSYGRPTSTTEAITGGTQATFSYTYDSNGRLATLTYPEGTALKYVYTSLGYLSQIVDNNTGTVYWQANARDAELHLTQATAGNGVVTTQNFDPNTGRILGICASPDGGTCDGATENFTYTWDNIDRLTSRADTYEGYTEQYCYDALNRLTNSATGSGVSSCTASGTGITTKSIAYDMLGNITSKSDVGTYAYPSPGSARPHAVTGITGTVNGVVNPTFTYDANGNMTAGDGRTFTYTSFNMVSQVTVGSNTNAFLYDDQHQRINQNFTSSVYTNYLNDPVTGAFVEVAINPPTGTWKDFIVAEGQIVAEHFNTAGTISVTYFHGDHLGSTSVLTNASGAVQERDSYDAWGRPRNANGTDNPSCTMSSVTTRGYTGQEMMPTICGVNLNARVYDPSLGRVMTADSYVPNPMDGQSYNRYSYVANDPLSKVDPSGHSVMPCYGCDMYSIDGSGDGDPSDGGGAPSSSDGSGSGGAGKGIPTIAVHGDPINVPTYGVYCCLGIEAGHDGSWYSSIRDGLGSFVGTTGQGIWKRVTTIVQSVNGDDPISETDWIRLPQMNMTSSLSVSPNLGDLSTADYSGRTASSVRQNGRGQCISPSAGPVYFRSFGFDLVMGVGTGITVSKFSIPSIGASGVAVTGYAFGGLGGNVGFSYGSVNSFSNFVGGGYNLTLETPIPVVGGALIWGNQGPVAGADLSTGGGGGIYGGRSITSIKSSNMPVCQ